MFVPEASALHQHVLFFSFFFLARGFVDAAASSIF